MPTIQTCKVKSKQTSNYFSTKLRYSGEIRLQTQMYQRKEKKKNKILRNEYIINGIAVKEGNGGEIRQKGSNGVFPSVIHGIQNTVRKFIYLLYNGVFLGSNRR